MKRSRYQDSRHQETGISDSLRRGRAQTGSHPLAPGFKRAHTLLLLALFGLVLTATAKAESAEEILKQAEELLYPENFYGVMEMYTHNPARRDTTMVYEIYFREDAGTMMEVTAPPAAGE